MQAKTGHLCRKAAGRGLCQACKLGMSGVSGNHQCKVNGVNQVNGMLRFGACLFLLIQQRKYSLIAWLWWPEGLAFLSSTALKPLERILGRLVPPEHHTDCKLNHILSSLCENGLFICSGVSA